MKIGFAVVGVSAAALCMFSLTGCVTTESEGSGTGAGAHHRGIVKHVHKGKETPAALTKTEWESEYGDVSVELTDHHRPETLVSAR